MHRHWATSDVWHWRQVWSVYLTDRHRSPNSVEDLEAHRLVCHLREFFKLRLCNGANVQRALCALREPNDADTESEVTALSILFNKAAALKCG